MASRNVRTVMRERNMGMGRPVSMSPEEYFKYCDRNKDRQKQIINEMKRLLLRKKKIKSTEMVDGFYVRVIYGDPPDQTAMLEIDISKKDVILRKITIDMRLDHPLMVLVLKVQPISI